MKRSLFIVVILMIATSLAMAQSETKSPYSSEFREMLELTMQLETGYGQPDKEKLAVITRNGGS